MNLVALLERHDFGMEHAHVRVAPASARWSEGAERLIALLPAELCWQHVGSTAVAGLEAKPILDVVGVAVPPLDLWERSLCAMGFEWLGEYGLPDRRFLRLRRGEFDYAHLHLFPVGHPHVTTMTRFRDRLRASPADREAYAVLKRSSAATHAADREAYTESKAAFIRACLV